MHRDESLDEAVSASRAEQTLPLPRPPASNWSSTSVSRVILPSLSSAAEIASAPVTRICAVCARQLGKYACPQCNVQSCSLPCYRQHSQRCTERFHAQEARAAMTGTKADDEAQKTMRDILRRAQQQPEDDDAAPLDSYDSYPDHEEAGERPTTENDDFDVDGDGDELERLREAAAAESLTLSSLSVEQQRRFLRAVKDGRLSRFVDVAVPWWVPSTARRLHSVRSDEDAAKRAEEGDGDEERQLYAREMEEEWAPHIERTMMVETADIGEVEGGDDLRAFVRSLPTLSSLVSSAPSPHLPYHVLDALFAYCYLYRVYNCDPQSDFAAFVADLRALSVVLAPPLPASQPSPLPLLNCSSSTIHHCLAHARRLPVLYQSPAFSLAAVRDALHLAMNAQRAMAALREVWTLLGRAAGKKDPPMRRKVWFFMVWLHDGGSEPLLAAAEEGADVLNFEEQRMQRATGEASAAAAAAAV